MHAGLSSNGDGMLAATYAIEFGLTVDDLDDTWAPCLTASEAFRITAGLFLHEHDVPYDPAGALALVTDCRLGVLITLGRTAVRRATSSTASATGRSSSR